MIAFVRIGVTHTLLGFVAEGVNLCHQRGGSLAVNPVKPVVPLLTTAQ